VYETTESPKDTKEITALRLDPDSAVMDCTIAGLEEAHPDVHLSSGTGTAGSYRLAMPPDGTYFLAWINQALAILTRTAMAGADLRNHRVDTALLECLIADAHAQIFLARDLLYAGDCGASVTELSLALGTMIALRDICWSFLSSGTLPIDSIPGIRSSVVSLDRACSMIVFD